MKRISSTSTAFYKKVFPAMWFGFLGVVVIVALAHGALATGRAIFLVGPTVMIVAGYFVMRTFVWDLADEVYDAGDHLVVRKRGTEHQVPFTDIMNVSSSMAVNPPRITLRLTAASAAGALGSEVAFSPERRFTLNPFAKSELVEDLIGRVDRARSKRAV